MSVLLFMASDAPFAERCNPHEKLLSINEALALGITDIPDFMLGEGFDRNQPNVILYMDREIEINPQTNEIEDGNFADDFAIFPFCHRNILASIRKSPSVRIWSGIAIQRKERKV